MAPKKALRKRTASVLYNEQFIAGLCSVDLPAENVEAASPSLAGKEREEIQTRRRRDM